MAPLQITLRATGARETYSHAGLAATHQTDALRRLCRLMVATGLRGPAEVRGEDGRLRLTVAAVEEAARWSLTENDRGLRTVLYRPFDAGKVPPAVQQVRDMARVGSSLRTPSVPVAVIKVAPRMPQGASPLLR